MRIGAIVLSHLTNTMNIFYLDKNPRVCAMLHGDKHVVKMAIESAQLLSAAHHLHPSSVDVSQLYKPTHVNHPCSKWVRQNTANYDWVFGLLQGLCLEFRIRRGKPHATERLIPLLTTNPDIPTADKHTFPALAMPDAFKTDDAVESYQMYYRQKYQEGIVSYDWSEDRNVPDFLNS